MHRYLGHEWGDVQRRVEMRREGKMGWTRTYWIAAMAVLAPTAAHGYDGTVRWMAGIGSGQGHYTPLRVVDADGDGADEIVLGNAEGVVHVIEWTGASYETVWRSASLGTETFGIAIGNCDGDPALELVAGTGEGFVHVFDHVAPDWTETFVTPQHGDEIKGVAIGDVDQDGVGEIAFGNHDARVRVYDYQGSNWVLQWESPMHVNYVVDLTVADADDDGDLDIVVGGGWSNSVYVYSWNGATYVQTWVSNVLQSSNFGVAVANLDADAAPEIMATSLWGYAYVFDHAGSGTAPVWTSIDLGAYLYTPAVGDIDGDGSIEFALGNELGQVQVFGWNGVTYAAETTTSTGDGHLSVAFGDPDDDGAPEYVTASSDGMLRVFRFEAASGLVEEWHATPPFSGLAVAAGDPDGDGEPEVAIGMYRAAAQGDLLAVGHTGTDYVTEWGAVITLPNALAIAEMDGAVGDEIAAGGENGQLSVFSSYGLAWQSASEGMPFTAAAAGDFEGLGQSQVAVIDLMDRLHIYGYDTGSWGKRFTSAGPVDMFVRSVATGQLDGDADAELAIVGQMGDLHIWGFDGATYIEEAAPATGSFGLTGLTTGDFDGDGTTEVAFGNDTGDLMVWGWDGGGYVEEWSTAVGSAINAVGAADVDNDTEVEIVAATEAGTLEVFGRSAPTYALESTVPNLGPALGAWDAITATDLNGNGWPEAIVGSPGYLFAVEFGGPGGAAGAGGAGGTAGAGATAGAGGTAGAGATAGAGGTGGAGATAGAGGTGASGGLAATEDDSSCGCRTVDSHGSAPMWLLVPVAGLAAIGRHRRRNTAQRRSPAP